MGETGKRPRSRKDQDGEVKYQKRRSSYKEETGDDELVIYRILCPESIIGIVIGKGGKLINSLRQETGAKIKVMDSFPGAKDRVITMYCYVKDKKDVDADDDLENVDPLCPAQDALLKVHAAIVRALSFARESKQKRKDKEEAHILVPSSQAANVIGKAGATIKKMRSLTGASIKVTPKDATDPEHSYAMDFDNFVMIMGDTEAVKRALYGVSSIMYKFSPKEEISLESTVPESVPGIIIPSEGPFYSAGGFYAGADPIVPPPRSVPPVMAATHVPELHGYSDSGSAWPVYSSSLPVVSGHGVPSHSEELIIRLLCHSDKIGRVIGKGGSSIKSLRQTTGARIEVDNIKDDRGELLITVTSTESVDDSKSMAVEAVLLLQEKINSNDNDDNVQIRLIVPSENIGCLIGKSGSIINDIRKTTKADVRIPKREKVKGAEANDELVEVAGKVDSVRDALVQLVLRLRDNVLKDSDGAHNPPPAEPLYSGSGGLSVPSGLSSGPSITPYGSSDQRIETGSGFGMLSSSSLYGYGSLLNGESGYGSSYLSTYGGLQPPSTLEVLIPANSLAKVMGKGGANIANIRKISGATIEILDSKSSRGARVARISGTSDQKRSAENLFQAFIMAT